VFAESRLAHAYEGLSCSDAVEFVDGWSSNGAALAFS
jgi:hypothetical protein